MHRSITGQKSNNSKTKNHRASIQFTPKTYTDRVGYFILIEIETRIWNLKFSFLPQTKYDTQKAKQERNKVVFSKITNVQKKRLPLDVNANFTSFPFEKSSYIRNNKSNIKPIQDFVVSKEISNYLEIIPSSEDCLYK